MVKRAAVFINGELADISRLKIKKTDLLIGVDGGAKHILKLGLKPDMIIGDLDSLKKFPKKIPTIKYPRDKDLSDTELALNYCVKQKIKEAVLVGFLGRRLDHIISNLMVLAKLSIKVSIIEGNEEIFFCKNKIEISGKKNDLISLIPLLEDCLGVTTQGLKWRLQGDSLQVGQGRGVSNVMLRNRCAVSLKRGCLLIIHTYRDVP